MEGAALEFLHAGHDEADLVLIVAALLFHLFLPETGDLLPEEDLGAFIRPVVFSLRVSLKGFNKRASMLSPCAAGSKPLLSAACPVGRPHGLLALGH